MAGGGAEACLYGRVAGGSTEVVWRRPALAVGTPVQRVGALQSDASVVVINYDSLDKLVDLSSLMGVCLMN